MTTREATCSCGALRLVAEGDPVRVSVCHCLAYQRRTGGPFGLQARFRRDQVRVEGEANQWVRISDEGESRTYSFCPVCGATVHYELASDPDVVAVPVGAFADPSFPPPTRSVWDQDRRHPWVTLPDNMDRAG